MSDIHTVAASDILIYYYVYFKIFSASIYIFHDNVFWYTCMVDSY